MNSIFYQSFSCWSEAQVNNVLYKKWSSTTFKGLTELASDDCDTRDALRWIGDGLLGDDDDDDDDDGDVDVDNDDESDGNDNIFENLWTLPFSAFFSKKQIDWKASVNHLHRIPREHTEHQQALIRFQPHHHCQLAWGVSGVW